MPAHGLAPFGRPVTTASNTRVDLMPDAISGPPGAYHLRLAAMPDARPSHWRIRCLLGRVGPGARIASSGPVLPEQGGLSPPRTASLRSAGPVNCLMPAHSVRPCDARTCSLVPQLFLPFRRAGLESEFRNFPARFPNLCEYVYAIETHGRRQARSASGTEHVRSAVVAPQGRRALVSAAYDRVCPRTAR